MKSPNKIILDNKTATNPPKDPNQLINANQGQGVGAQWDVRTRTWVTPKDPKDIVKSPYDF